MESMKLAAAVIALGLILGIVVWDSARQTKILDACKRERIMPLSADHFTWEGINRLVGKGDYQPKCL